MNRDFKGVWIPKEIWEMKDLSMSEKVLIVEIDSLDTGNGCWAGNNHFAELIGRTPETIKNMITDLTNRGVIERIDGDKRYLKVLIIRHEKMPPIPPTGHEKMLPVAQKNAPYIESNTENNTTSVVSASPSTPIQEVIGKALWDNGKTDLQRFIGFYIRTNMSHLYNGANKSQVAGFYRQYCKLFSTLLASAGSLDIACRAMDCADKYYKKLGYGWGLKALNSNWAEFVSEAMARKQ